MTSNNDLKDKLLRAEQFIKVGKTYRHYKSADMTYEVLALAFEEETLDLVVVYKALYGDKLTFTRPVSVWLESVELDGVSVARFAPIEEPSEK